MACWAAMRANWVKRSIFLASRLPKTLSMSRFFTSPASFTRMSEQSYRVMGPMPHLPSLTACQLSATLFPMGFTVPMPVITTLRFSIVTS